MQLSILLVDDHKIVREGTRQLLEQSPDMKVIGEASDGYEALEMANEFHPDVIVMDVRLPRLNGIEATRIISSHYPDIKVLILSAYDDDSYVFPLLEAGASGYLLKTASGAELAEAIRLVYTGQMALSPRISAKIVNRLSGRPTSRKDRLPESLTERELEVLRATARGLSNKMIALELQISVQTVQVHLRNIFGKLGVTSRSEAVARALQFKWISLEANDG